MGGAVVSDLQGDEQALQTSHLNGRQKRLSCLTVNRATFGNSQRVCLNRFDCGGPFGERDLERLRFDAGRGGHSKMMVNATYFHCALAHAANAKKHVQGGFGRRRA